MEQDPLMEQMYRTEKMFGVMSPMDYLSAMLARKGWSFICYSTIMDDVRKNWFGNLVRSERALVMWLPELNIKRHAFYYNDGEEYTTDLCASYVLNEIADKIQEEKRQRSSDVEYHISKAPVDDTHAYRRFLIETRWENDSLCRALDEVDSGESNIITCVACGDTIRHGVSNPAYMWLAFPFLIEGLLQSTCWFCSEMCFDRTFVERVQYRRFYRNDVTNFDITNLHEEYYLAAIDFTSLAKIRFTDLGGNELYPATCLLCREFICTCRGLRYYTRVQQVPLVYPKSLLNEDTCYDDQCDCHYYKWIRNSTHESRTYLNYGVKYVDDWIEIE